MKETKNSSVSIVLNKRVIGVFNVTSLFHAYLNKEGEMLLDLSGSTFIDYFNNFNMDNMTYFSCKFISSAKDIYSCFQEFELEYKMDKKLELLFVTENGKPAESLLGLISIFDLINEIQ